jgi:glutathione peroxidase-family protein
VTVDTLPVHSIYRLSMKDANGMIQSLSQYIGKVTLVVNTACL